MSPFRSPKRDRGADVDATVVSRLLDAKATVPFRATPIPPPDCSLEEIFESARNMTVNTAVFDATGHPSISVPCGMADDLPIGMMITGRHFDDLTVLQVADAVEKSGDWQGFWSPLPAVRARGLEAMREASWQTGGVPVRFGAVRGTRRAAIRPR